MASLNNFNPAKIVDPVTGLAQDAKSGNVGAVATGLAGGPVITQMREGAKAVGANDPFASAEKGINKAAGNVGNIFKGGQVPIPGGPIPQVSIPQMPPGMGPVSVTGAPTGYAVPTMNAASVNLPPGMTAATATTPAAMQAASAQLTGSLTPAQIAFDTNAKYGLEGQNAQNALIAQLLRQSRGGGPSVAGAQLKSAQDANLAATMAQLASARGGANPLLQRTAMNTSADIQAQTARDAAIARMQEQMNAQGLLGQVSGQVVGQGLTQRGQDIGIAAQNAGFAQEAGLAQYGAQTEADLLNAQLAQQAAQTNYGGALETNLANAGFAQDAAKTNYGGSLQGALATAGLNQDANMANFQATLGQNRDVFMQGTQLAGQNAGYQQAHNELMAKYTAMGLSAEQANQAAELDLQRIVAGAQATNAGMDEAAKARQAAMIGAILSGGAGIAAAGVGSPVGAAGAGAAAPVTASAGPSSTPYNSATGDYSPPGQPYYSDSSLKKDVSDGSEDMDEFLSAIRTNKYKYKDKKHGRGEFVGPMTQEMVGTIGKSLVHKGADGDMVDTGRAALVALSAAGLLHKRLKELEKKGKK